MKSLEQERTNANLLVCIIFFIISICLTIILSITLTRDAKLMNLTHDQLNYEIKEFDYYKMSKSSFYLYFKDGTKYEIYGYADGQDDILSLIEKGENISFYSLDEEIIIELQYNNVYAVNLNNYKNGAHQNFIISFILIIVFALFGITSLLVGLIIIVKLKSTKRYYYHDSFDDDNIINKDIYEKIQKSLYKKDGIYHGNILELIESPNLITTFSKAIMDIINDNELTLIIDDCGKDDCIALVFYKLNNKLYFNQIFREKNEAFKIDNDLFWYYPSNLKVTINEKEEFEKAINEYCLFNPNLLAVEIIKK